MLAKGLCERIGLDGRLVYQKAGGEKEITDADMPTHKQAIQMVLDALVNPKTGALKSLSEIGAVGHRVVHGGEKFASSTILNEEVLGVIEECNDLAPLHNPANLIGIRACQELMPNVPMVGVFDTAFHQTMPEKAYLYGIDYDYYEKYKVRRYGFHGTSHSYVSKRAAEIVGKPYGELRTIVCHLGNGASICAVENGKSIDTSMGLTPLEGLIMGTRSGDIDPGAMEYLAKKEGTDLEGVMEILNKKSGVLGLSDGLSSGFAGRTPARHGYHCAYQGRPCDRLFRAGRLRRSFLQCGAGNEYGHPSDPPAENSFHRPYDGCPFYQRRVCPFRQKSHKCTPHAAGNMALCKIPPLGHEPLYLYSSFRLLSGPYGDGACLPSAVLFCGQSGNCRRRWHFFRLCSAAALRTYRLHAHGLQSF